MMHRVSVFLLLLVATAPVHADEYGEVRAQLQTCLPCHGEGGASKIPQNPVLAGQHLHYLFVQMRDFKSGARKNAVMQPMMQVLSTKQMQLIAEYFSKQKWPKSSVKAPPRKVAARGKAVVTGGQCVQCHLGKFEGASGVPRVAGQFPEYIEKTLLEFKHKVRTNSPAKVSLLATFSDEDIKAVSAYITSFKP